MNLAELLDSAACRWPEKPALVEGDIIVSYVQLVEKAARFASQLQLFKLSPGCRVGLFYPNSIDYVALTFALWRVNAVVVPIPMECTAVEISDIAAAMQLEVILSQKAIGQSAVLSPECFLTRLAPTVPPDNHGLNLAFIRFTSGTTSARKGVALTHETVRDRVTTANQALGINSTDTVMWCLPMAHHFLITIILYLSEGATVVFARHVLAQPFLKAVNRWQGTFLYAAPFHYALLARDNSPARLDSVRLAVSTTCALSQDVAEDFYKRFDRPLVQALGIIELGLVSLNTGDPRGRWNSVGRLVSGHQININAPDENGCGELSVAGPGFFDAYVAPWLPREAVSPDGWFHTGDIARLDDEGFLFLISRKNAVINLAGRKIFPEEIEAVLNRHPAVRESRVYARAHPQLGEIVEAEIVPDQPAADLDSLRTFCRTHLADYKIPVNFHRVNALPRTTATGKIRRAVVAA
ncbi:MAG: class I adenylate-forming enzyme family protein [Limisphaerales bacterium]